MNSTENCPVCIVPPRADERYCYYTRKQNLHQSLVHMQVQKGHLLLIRILSILPMCSHNPTSILSESSYVVSEVDDAPCGYIYVVNRLRLSVIFESDEEQADTMADLPNSVYQNIREFKRAILTKRFYNQPEPSSNFVELSLNNILSSTYLLHGTDRIKNKGSELNLIATSVSTFLSPFFSSHDDVQMEFDSISWVYKQQEVVDENKLRPDILIHARQHGQVIEVACGEVKKPGVSQERLNKDRIRVLEMMKRQLHIRLKYAKAHYETVTFGILVQGFSVVLIQMTLDLTKGVYIYQEQPPFPLPTTFETYSHMDTSMEFMQTFKGKMIDSLLKPEDNNKSQIWEEYKGHRPYMSISVCINLSKCLRININIKFYCHSRSHPSVGSVKSIPRVYHSIMLSEEKIESGGVTARIAVKLLEIATDQRVSYLSNKSLSMRGLGCHIAAKWPRCQVRLSDAFANH
ncbi:uncharacterized protein BX663DRAFT_488291 [Cokeromyces recurvatus]|uniref:uncharacterized protein n=1 Tax=Cokeromyces recurvatus TaxID=90255 RepID=UPI0022210CF7|nr:uncharacterized protein BX663DRAFT_488291 [Cokeromyces recurvatus]KAI7900678.1 hypothetical protein BX663DRAFT_488291 [Cokeromyces recurvatus]